MNKAALLQEIKQCYESGKNIIEYLHSIEEGGGDNSFEDILISYDFQAGNYYRRYKENPEYYSKMYDEMAEILSAYIASEDNSSILEAGVGEGRSLVSILNRINCSKVKGVYGFDASWSRIKYAEKFEKEFLLNQEEEISFFTSDIINIAVKNSAVDIVFTVHAVEPNGGKEKQVLEELYRITNRYLVMFEPAYEFAGEEARSRMEHHGYITRLYESAVELGYTIIRHELLQNLMDPMNPTGIIVIEKKQNGGKNKEDNIFCDSILKEELQMGKNECYCEKSMLAYPIIGGVPCLLADNAIVATKYNEFC